MLIGKKGDMRMLGVWALLFLVGVAGLVMAVTPNWDPASHVSPYWAVEDSLHLHNFTLNVTNYVNSMTFEILNENVTWNGGNVDYSQIQNWIYIENSSEGILFLNATDNNMTGNFTFHVLARDGTSSSGEDFNFIINATNDAPNFTLASSYNVSVPVVGSEATNITLIGSDEEEQYPLEYNVTINNCSFASWSSRNSSDCSLNNATYFVSDVRSELEFSNLTYNDIGVYNLTVCVHDNVNGTTPPVYRDADYDFNKSQCYNTTLELLSTLSIDVSDCDGVSLMEDEWLNCTINVTTVGETDTVNISSYAFFTNHSGNPVKNNNRSYFFGDASEDAVDYFIEKNVSVQSSKEWVGYWTINFTATDGVSVPQSDLAYVFVNYTEDSVSLNSISDVSIYGDDSDDNNFEIRAIDDDLLIGDPSVKDEDLTFGVNVSWITITEQGHGSWENYIDANVFVNYTKVKNESGLGNYSVLINVTDLNGSVASRAFVVEISNATTPEWNSSLDDPVVLELVEDSAFSYNVSKNVSDSGQTLDFSYYNLTEEFCSLNSSNFNSSGMISFTPEDCDVGLHNVTISASNGKFTSNWSFVFNVTNVYDVPSIVSGIEGENGTTVSLFEGDSLILEEKVVGNFSLYVSDEDFRILQKGYYNESFNVSVVFIKNGSVVDDLFGFDFVSMSGVNDDVAGYNATFTANVSHVGNYSVFVEIVDEAGNSTNRTFYLNVTEKLDPPVLGNVSNYSLTIYDYLNFSLNATDDEDDYNNVSLVYSVLNLSVGAPNLTISSGGVVSFNMSSNSSYAGKWSYNATVNDSDGMVDWQEFWVFVYGNATLVSPSEGSVYNLTENTTSVLNFTISHAVGDNLTYEFWLDNVSCPYFQNVTNCSWGNLSFREIVSGNNGTYSWSFTPNYNDETYGLLKNLTVRVYPNSSELTTNQSESVAVNFSFKLNVSHANAPMRVVNATNIYLSTNYNAVKRVDLSEYFSDEDVDDSYYAQNISFKIASSDLETTTVNHVGGWNVDIGTSQNTVHQDTISIYGEDYVFGTSNVSLTNDTLSNINVEFTAPTTRTSSSSSSKTVVKFFSIRIILPEDVIISDDDYIEVPFALENTGGIDLRGINLSSTVLYNNAFAEGVKVDLGDTYVEELRMGERRNYTMTIYADTDRAGKYKVTVFANVTSPKFSDWGEFFIDLRRTNESEAEKLLVFIEKMIVENPECLELTEVFRRAQEAFDSGDYVQSVKLAQQTVEACEDMISAAEQIKYSIEGFIERNFYYIFFTTIVIFVLGFGFYVYRRVRFNKSGEDDYIG